MNSKTPTFLIVDDEPDMCWTLERLLEDRGFPSVTADNGKDALRLLKKERAAVVLLDAKLPDIEGLDLAAQMREVDPKIRIVLISGYFYCNDEAIEKALEDGLIRDFISKPFLHDQVLEAVDRAVSP